MVLKTDLSAGEAAGSIPPSGDDENLNDPSHEININQFVFGNQSVHYQPHIVQYLKLQSLLKTHWLVVCILVNSLFLCICITIFVFVFFPIFYSLTALLRPGKLFVFVYLYFYLCSCVFPNLLLT